MAAQATPLLQTYGLTKRFRGFVAVDNVDLSVQAGSIHALVGPNGAGKTTLFNMLSGFVRPSAGRIVVHGHDVTRMAPDQIARRGVGRSFQITSLFEQLSSVEHVSLALQSATGLGYRFWRSERALSRFRPRSLELLAEVGLESLAEREVHTLAYGQKRALELALALALAPELVLLDEPTAGMGVEEVARIITLIRRIAVGRTVVLVEHNMGVVGELADRVTVLQRGTILAEGPYAEVRRDARVVTAYLGQVEEPVGDAQH
ncbi:MAG: ABC transporter ATP-binding protein [Chloroflexota bacterium]|nr:ABC transporter ATP-binding protein [Chloroflexota bacterium]